MEPPEWGDDSHLLFFYCTTQILHKSDNPPQPPNILVKPPKFWYILGSPKLTNWETK